MLFLFNAHPLNILRSKKLTPAVRILWLCTKIANEQKRMETLRLLIKHSETYLMKCLFNAPETFENKVAMDVNHDLFGERRRE